MDPLTILGALGGLWVLNKVRGWIFHGRKSEEGGEVTSKTVGDTPSGPDESSATKMDPPRQSEVIGYLRSRQPADYEGAKGDMSLRGEPGIYAWYFDSIPENLRTEECHWIGKWALLYVGKAKSLRARILRDHFKGNAEGSTLRLTLGCLLMTELDIRLGRTQPREDGKKGRWTFGSAGEEKLTRWMLTHARVTWASLRDGSIHWPLDATPRSDDDVVHEVEGDLIRRLYLPLNVDRNRAGVAIEATRVREACKRAAVVIDDVS